jgi:cell division protein ZipA
MCQNRRWFVLSRLCVIAGALTMGCGTDGSDGTSVNVRGNELQEALASESDARAHRVLPAKGSEDVSKLLVNPTPNAQSTDGESATDILPDPATDWIIDVQFDGEPRLDSKQISKLFDKKWREQFGELTLYARDPDARHWTYLLSSDGPTVVTGLKFAWRFIDATTDNPENPAPQVFSDREAAIRKSLAALGTPVLKASHSPEDAARRARFLRDFKTKLDYSATLVLRAPKGKTFEGRDIWDVMLCLGLAWGDMDIFHWVNDGGRGDSAFFSVSTSTSPGYFFPDQIAAGKVHVDDLVFGFSAPRCSHPADVFESMMRAVNYAQKRLGGTILDGSGSKANVDKTRQKIRGVELEMKSHGFTPGDDSALRLF